MSPNQPRTPIRGVRVPDSVWLAAKVKAAAEGRTVSDVVNDCLRRYVVDESDIGDTEGGR